MKFTFKREKAETGLRAVGHPYANVTIKFNGKEVGTIIGPSWNTHDNLWRITFSIKVTPTAEAPASWKWINLKFRGKDEEECRKFILDNAETLIKFNLHTIE